MKKLFLMFLSLVAGLLILSSCSLLGNFPYNSATTDSAETTEIPETSVTDDPSAPVTAVEKARISVNDFLAALADENAGTGADLFSELRSVSFSLTEDGATEPFLAMRDGLLYLSDPDEEERSVYLLPFTEKGYALLNSVGDSSAVVKAVPFSFADLAGRQNADLRFETGELSATKTAGTFEINRLWFSRMGWIDSTSQSAKYSGQVKLSETDGVSSLALNASTDAFTVNLTVTGNPEKPDITLKFYLNGNNGTVNSTRPIMLSVHRTTGEGTETVNLNVSASLYDDKTRITADAEIAYEVGPAGQPASFAGTCTLTVGDEPMILEIFRFEPPENVEADESFLTGRITGSVFGHEIETLSFTATATSGSDDKKIYPFHFENTSEKSDVVLEIPARAFELTKAEQTLLSRVNYYYENMETVNEQIRRINESATTYFSRYLNSSTPRHFYTYDESGTLILLTLVSGNQVQTSCVFDEKPIVPIACRHSGNFADYELSPAYRAAEQLKRDWNTAINQVEKEYSRSVHAYFCHYLEDYDLTVGFYGGANDTTPNFVSGRQIAINNIAAIYVPEGAFSLLDLCTEGPIYDEQCHRILTTPVPTAIRLTSWESVHNTDESQVLLSPAANRLGATLIRCDRCNKAYLQFENEGGTTRFLATLEQFGKYRSNDGQISGLIPQERDSDWVITYIDWEQYDGNFQTPDLAVPALPPEMGTLIGWFAGTDSIVQFYGTVELPEGFLFLGNSALEKMHPKGIRLPESLLYIGYRSLYSNFAEEITVPENVVYIGNHAFRSSTLKKLTVDAKHLTEFGAQELPALEELIFHSESIGSYYPPNAPKLTAVAIPEGVRKLLYNNSVTFSGRVVLPSTLTEIDGNFFMDNKDLTEVVLPAGLTIIGEYAFCNCTSLARVWVASNGATEGTDGKLELPLGLQKLGLRAFSGCPLLKYVEIPSGITVLPQGVFLESGLETVVLPDEMVGIHMGAFSKCKSLRSVNLPSALTWIGQSAFSGCESLEFETILFGNGMKQIDAFAFQNCKRIQRVDLPASLTRIQSTAFEGCEIGEMNVYCDLSKDTSSPGGSVNVINYYGKIGVFIWRSGKIINIHATELPESVAVVHQIPKSVVEINFAGDRETWNAAGYRIPYDSQTVVHFNVDFGDNTPPED